MIEIRINFATTTVEYNSYRAAPHINRILDKGWHLDWKLKLIELITDD